MKPNYKNWVPRGMVISVLGATVVLGIAFFVVLLTSLLGGTAKTVTEIILGVLFAIGIIYSGFCINWYTAFSYNGKRQYSKKIIDMIADYVVLPENGTGLDVGCGSGALTIACAKRNKQAKMVGLDRWGKEYASFNKPLCENNAKLEGVSENTSFVRGDACKLDFPDETFDAVTSNFCYHNIYSTDRQAIILETLRVLKKGGIFVIHDEFTRSKYGNTDELVNKIKALGYEKVELLDTMDGLFLSKKEATPLALVGSGLLIGKK